MAIFFAQRFHIFMLEVIFSRLRLDAHYTDLAKMADRIRSSAIHEMCQRSPKGVTLRVSFRFQNFSAQKPSLHTDHTLRNGDFECGPEQRRISNELQDATRYLYARISNCHDEGNSTLYLYSRAATILAGPE